jgi:hypothetical protein
VIPFLTLAVSIFRKEVRMAAADENKKQMPLMTLMIAGTAKALHDMFGASAVVVMNEAGRAALELLEQETGRKIEGQEPEQVLREIGRIFTDRLGVVGSFAVSREGRRLTVTIQHCHGWGLKQVVMKTGIDTPFICPIMNICQAALARIGCPARKSIAPVPKTRGSTITFTLAE